MAASAVADGSSQLKEAANAAGATIASSSEKIKDRAVSTDAEGGLQPQFGRKYSIALIESHQVSTVANSTQKRMASRIGMSRLVISRPSAQALQKLCPSIDCAMTFQWADSFGADSNR
jgi:hypothetical protein